MENTPFLETDRLILRRFAETDIPALLTIYGNEEANTFLPWYPIRSMEEAAALYEERYAASYRLPRGYRYAVCLKEDNLPIGYVHADAEGAHDLGYGLLPAFWGQGIITDACRAVIAQLKADGLPFITATHDVNNPRSGGVMRRLGMKYMYSYEEQWQPKDFPVVFRLYQLNFDGQDDCIYMEYWNRYPVHFREAGL